MGLLRLFLALSIVFQHSGKNWGIGGGRAVEIFFIISGFYMSLILTTGKYKEYKTFITNRFLRIYPIYFVIAISTLFLSFVTNTAPFPQYGVYGKDFNFISWIFFAFSNLTLIAQDVTLFMGIQDGHLYGVADFAKVTPLVAGFLLIPQAWSLSIELMFYCIAPAFLWLKKLPKIIVLSFFILLSMACKIWLILGGFPYDPWAYRFFPSVLYLFLLGSLVHHFYDAYFVSMFEKVRKRHIAYVLAFTPLIGIFCWMKGFTRADLTFRTITKSLQNLLAIEGYEPLINEIVNATVPFIVCACLICILFYATSRNSIDRFIGELSYPVYVVHILIINILGVVMARDSIFSILAAGITILVSIGLVKYVQAPIEKYRMLRLKGKNRAFEMSPIKEVQGQTVRVA